MKTLLITLALGLAQAAGALGQTFGEIQAKTRDESGAPLPGVIVVADNGSGLRGEATDLDGDIRLGALSPGKYTVTFRMTSKHSVTYNDVVVVPDRITRLGEIVMRDSTVALKGAVVVEYLKPLIEEDGGTVVRISAKELKNMPSANGGDLKKIVASLTSDVKVSPGGDELYFRGSRSGSVVYFIDGVKIWGQIPNIPSSGISNIAVYSGGVPAKYGDSTGGYIVVETKSYLEDYYEKISRSR
ncbi:MAG: carboxypeptidase regulatory-like domain-containing protein [Flavobacteriales bacterium]|jgi:hypothetical protein